MAVSDKNLKSYNKIEDSEVALNYMEVPFTKPDMSELEVEMVAEVLRSSWITTGPKTKLFEKNIAEFCDAEKAVCLNSATAVMEMILRLFDIGEGDEVITSAYTYTASASVICHVGATPVFVDTAPGSFEMDYDKLEEAITEKTKAIIPVDIAGVMCDYDKIIEIAEREKCLFKPSGKYQEALGRVLILADSAHGFGSSYKGRKSGSVADFTGFSFHAVKNLTTAEGGAMTFKPLPGIDNEEVYKRFMLLSLHGQSKDAFEKTCKGSWEYDIIMPAYKCNMTDITAAIGLAQLERYGDMVERRKKITEIYDEELKGLDIDILKHKTAEYQSNYHLYMVRLNGKDAEYRNAFIINMAEHGIKCNVHFKPLPMHSAYKNMGFDISDYPNAYKQYENEVTLPLYSTMTEEEARYVAKVFRSILK